MSGYIVSNSTNAFSSEPNALQTQIREYIKVCLDADNPTRAFRVYGGLALDSTVLPTVVFITPNKANKEDDCGLLLAEAIGMDADTVDLTFQMWNNEKIQLSNSPGNDDMLYRSNILDKMQKNAVVSGKLLDIVNNRRFWKQANYKQQPDSEMVTYILFTRYKFEVDSSGGSVPRLKNAHGGQTQVLERKNVIIFAIDLLKFFGLAPFDIESPYKVKWNATSQKYEVTH